MEHSVSSDSTSTKLGHGWPHKYDSPDLKREARNAQRQAQYALSQRFLVKLLYYLTTWVNYSTTRGKLKGIPLACTALCIGYNGGNSKINGHKMKGHKKIENSGKEGEGEEDKGETDKGETDEGEKDEGKKDEGKKDEGKKDEGKKDEGKKDEGETDEGEGNEGKVAGVWEGGMEETFSPILHDRHRDQSIPYDDNFLRWRADQELAILGERWVSAMELVDVLERQNEDLREEVVELKVRLKMYS
jgi:hypothetical protein